MESHELETLIIDASDNGVVTVTMNRPEKKNAANSVMWDELRDTWNALAGDPQVRAVRMTGAGAAGCRGADGGGHHRARHP
ncbi:MAG: enoyl-CoA hydratase-related protein, partial [Actinomycetota bacterium]|nr:enoyl-CoA hydratase-related protein [Actinomycetota bacterium]